MLVQAGCWNVAPGGWHGVVGVSELGIMMQGIACWLRWVGSTIWLLPSLQASTMFLLSTIQHVVCEIVISVRMTDYGWVAWQMAAGHRDS